LFIYFLEKKVFKNVVFVLKNFFTKILLNLLKYCKNIATLFLFAFKVLLKKYQRSACNAEEFYFSFYGAIQYVIFL